jgi:hypothetical protein
MTYFNDDDIPHVWNWVNEIRHTMALQDFIETPQWHAFAHAHAYIDFMHAYLARIQDQSSPGDCFGKEAKTTAEVRPSAGLINLSRGGGYECDEYNHVTVHYKILYKYS